MALKAKHRNPIIAMCVVVVFLGIFIATLLVCARRFNKEAIARRAREAERHAAQAVARAERRRRPELDLPEAEAAPANGKYKDPALGNVVIKDLAAFLKLKDELVEVEMPNGSASKKGNGALGPASPCVTAEPEETFNDDASHEPHSPAPGPADSTSNFLSEVCNDANEGGFVIVVCGGRVEGAAETTTQNNNNNDINGTAEPTMAPYQEKAAVEASAHAPSHPSNNPTVHFYRHQPSRSFYGESRYTDEPKSQGDQ